MAEPKSTLTVEELIEFIDNTMRMSHIYQPLLIQSLVESGGQATLRELAVKFLSEEEAEFVKHRFTHEFAHEDWRDGFVIGGKYTRADVFRILGLEFNPVAQNVGGYMIDAGTHSCPIFVTYHKSEDISESTQYEDHFIDPLTLHYFSKSNRSMKSNDIQFFLQAARGSGARMPLFVKKSDDEGIDFYYLGELTPLADSFQEDRMASKGGKPGPKVVRMDMRLSDPVPADLYHYLQDSL
jgi:hypothetical protein